MKPSSLSRKKFSIRFTVGTMFTVATVLTAVVAISLQYYFGRQMAQEHALTKLTMASADISEYIQQVESNATSSAQILRSVSNATGDQFSESEIRDIFIQVLRDNPLFYSLYYANHQEDFYQIINLNSSPIVRERINANEKDRWVVIKIFGLGTQRIRTTEYYDSQLTRTRIEAERSNYFPTQRPWYHSAAADSVYKTEPYLFKHLKITGQTYSTRSDNSVIGVDIVLSAVSSKISAQALGVRSDSSVQAFIFNQRGEVLASNLPQRTEIRIPQSHPMAMTNEQAQLVKSAPTLVISNQNDWAPYDYSNAGEPQGYAVDTFKLMSQITGLKFEFVNGFSSNQLIEKFHQGKLDVLHSVAAVDDLDSRVSSMQLYTSPMGIAGLQNKDLPTHLDQLQSSKIAVVEGRGFAQRLKGKSPGLNIKVVADFEKAHQLLVNGNVNYLIDGYFVLHEMTSLTQNDQVRVEPIAKRENLPLNLYLTPKYEELLPILQQAHQSITKEQHLALTQKWLNPEVSRGGLVPNKELFQLSQDSSQSRKMIETQDGQSYLYVTSVSQGEIKEYFAVVIPKQVIMGQVYSRLITSTVITAIALMIILPLAWLFGVPIVVPITQLRKETKLIQQRQFDQVSLIDSRIKEVYELSQSMLEMGQEIERYHKEREAFMDAFIYVIAQAIDDKSPYTAGHCNRVPELGILLAQIVEETNHGKFKDFCFKNDDERREFKIAAWLHDCGKITTPEHIVDKGTKLEANYNRIHEIRTRFEVLWRDAEIEYLNAILNQDVTKEQAFETLHSRHSQLQKDFEFIAKANVGGEFMSEDKIARIKEISKQTWLRHFDNRLGLSPFEELSSMPNKQPLPALEPLLADKPEHIIERVRPLDFDPTLQFKIDIPKYQSNLGEVYNLSISRGTLTTEDRFRINEHMTNGIKMLEALPFPPELARVPRYASTHHETLDGRGYPRKLDASQLSIPERVLAIADIFEALTAADRPYKKAKPYSVAIDIMHSMAKNKHIDYDLFMLFLTSGGFEQYARLYLPASQIDDVDVKQYLAEHSES